MYVSTEDEFTYRISNDAKAFLSLLGSPEAEPAYRSSLALIAVANGDGTFETKGVVYNTAGHGPSSLQGVIQTGQ